MDCVCNLRKFIYIDKNTGIQYVYYKCLICSKKYSSFDALKKGPQGPRGVQGPQGDTGPRGKKGLTGDQGFIGFSGPKGTDGSDGKTIMLFN